jgi:hypothetical protein
MSLITVLCRFGCTAFVGYTQSFGVRYQRLAAAADCAMGILEQDDYISSQPSEGIAVAILVLFVQALHYDELTASILRPRTALRMPR